MRHVPETLQIQALACGSPQVRVPKRTHARMPVLSLQREKVEVFKAARCTNAQRLFTAINVSDYCGPAHSHCGSAPNNSGSFRQIQVRSLRQVVRQIDFVAEAPEVRLPEGGDV